MRDSVPRASVMAHTLSALAAIPMRAGPIPIGSVAVTLAALASIRAMDFAPHAPVHTAPNAFTAPPHGSLTPVTGSASFFSFARASMRTSPSFAALGSAIVSTTAIHPGAFPSYSISDFSDANGICTPGVLMPFAGATGGAAFFCSPAA